MKFVSNYKSLPEEQCKIFIVLNTKSLLKILILLSVNFGKENRQVIFIVVLAEFGPRGHEFVCTKPSVLLLKTYL